MYMHGWFITKYNKMKLYHKVSPRTKTTSLSLLVHFMAQMKLVMLRAFLFSLYDHYGHYNHYKQM